MWWNISQVGADRETSGFMQRTTKRLAGGNQAIALLGNTIPTGAILVVIITILGPISGAHFNPAVTLVFASRGIMPWSETPVSLPTSSCFPSTTCKCFTFAGRDIFQPPGRIIAKRNVGSRLWRSIPQSRNFSVAQFRKA
jgi:hypothetical protein